MWKSILAILAGILALTISSFGIEAVANPVFMRALSLPDAAALGKHSGVMAFTFVYGLICVAFGGYVCARLAPRLPLHHAIAMGVLQSCLTVVAMLSMPELASRTFWIGTAVLAFPAAIVGGLGYARQPRTAG